MYRLAGNFRGRKLSWISRFCSYLRKFSLRNFGACCPLERQKHAIRESFLCDNCIFHQFVKISSLENFPLYGMLFLQSVSLDIPIYGSIIICLQGNENTAVLFNWRGIYCTCVLTMLSTGNVCYSTNYIPIYGIHFFVYKEVKIQLFCSIEGGYSCRTVHMWWLCRVQEMYIVLQIG